MTAPNLQPGELFEGRYRVEKQVGTGGFSKVYSARDERQGVHVAIKILTPLDQVEGGNGGNPTELADRFLREARVLSTLRNPHSIIMYDHGNSSRGQLYMVFEFIGGRSLFEMIRDDGPQPAHLVAKVLEGTLKSLQDAHAQGLLHRDIKPNNLMLAEQSGGHVLKVLDFGIAKAYGDAAGVVPGNDLTAAGVLVGTPRYMPPEQLRGEVVGPAGDIYSLGIVAVEMVTGQKAIRGKDRIAVITQQVSPQSIKLPPEAHLPLRLRMIVERMVEKNGRIRYSSAAEILRDLKTWTSDAPLIIPGEATEPVHIPQDEDKTFVTTVKAGELALAGVDKTVLQTVNVAQLDRAIAEADASGAWNSADQNVAGRAAQDNEATKERAVLSSPGQWPPPADRSGNNFQTVDQSGHNFPTVDQSAGRLQAAANASQPFSTSLSSQGTFQPADSSGPWDTAGQASLSARQQFSMTSADSAGNIQVGTLAFELTSAQKVVLGISCFVPGVAHLAFGQPKKGMVILLAFLLSLGLLLLVSLAIALDAYLVLRAKSHRDVGDFEFFPDYKQFLS